MRRPPSSPNLDFRDLLRSRSARSWQSLPGAQRVLLTYSGRGAIHQYLARQARSGALSVGRNVVLVPSFHCPTVVDPVIHAGFDVRFYAVHHNLMVDDEDFLGKLDDRVAVALFIRYFGFAGLNRGLMAASKAAGALVLEDCSHSFLSTAPLRLSDSGADATTYSFWKLLPGRAGGGLLIRGGADQANRLRLTTPPCAERWLRTRTLLGQIVDEQRLHLPAREPSGEAALVGDQNAAPAVRLSAGEAYPYDRAASSWKMPLMSRQILRSADLVSIAEARRRNYTTYLERLEPCAEMQPVFAALPPDVCPWGLPVILRQRGRRDYKIRGRGVPLFTFGEVLHPLLGERHPAETSMLDRARYLADNLLAFSIHQGLSAAQIGTFASTINRLMTDLPAA